MESEIKISMIESISDDDIKQSINDLRKILEIDVAFLWNFEKDIKRSESSYLQLLIKIIEMDILAEYYIDDYDSIKNIESVLRNVFNSNELNDDEKEYIADIAYRCIDCIKLLNLENYRLSCE